jgi:hypothetical protein
MEEDSQEEDSSLRDYWTKTRGKKQREKTKDGDKRSVSGEADSTDHEGQDKHEGNTLDPTKLTTFTSANEDTLQNKNHTSSTSEEIPSSPLYTSHLELQNNEGDSDDVLLDFNEFSSEENNSPGPIQPSHDEDITMEGAASPNQAESAGPETSVEQASSSAPENNSDLPAQGSSSDQIQSVTGTDNTSFALPQANTSIITVDVVNDIVKGDRASSSPIREHTSSLDFFNIKEQRYLQHMQKFWNGDGRHCQPSDRHVTDPSIGNGTARQKNSSTRKMNTK